MRVAHKLSTFGVGGHDQDNPVTFPLSQYSTLLPSLELTMHMAGEHQDWGNGKS